MNKYRAVFCCLLIAASLLSVSQALAALPELLRERNFNFYPAPFPANDMVLRNVNGGMVSLSGLRGKVLILNFWKIDCPPCSVEKPILERIRQKYSRRGLEIVAVNLFDTGDRVKAYSQSGHFGFTFAFDPENRFSVRRYTLPSGMPTAFVINSSSEAIYEIPGVPTTYLINRRGEVVGNSMGMVNWEEPPFIELLESLLGTASQVVAQNNRDFSSTAKQGTNPSPAPQVAPPTAGATSPQAQEQGFLPQTAQATQPVQSSPPHPFQQAPIAPTPGLSQPSPGAQSAPTGPNVVPSQSTAKPQATKPVPATRAGRKPQVARPDAAIATYPKPRSTGTTAAAASSPGLRTSGGVTAPAGTRPGVIPPVTQPVPPGATAPALGGAASLPRLPPALPYVPGRAQVPRPNIEPDEQGNVTARIPDYGQGGHSAGPALPPSQEVASGGPIGGFILDSFGTVRPQGVQPPQRIQSPSVQTPPASVFGQLNEDVQALGAGIKETFSRILPGK